MLTFIPSSVEVVSAHIYPNNNMYVGEKIYKWKPILNSLTGKVFFCASSHTHCSEVAKTIWGEVNYTPSCPLQLLAYKLWMHEHCDHIYYKVWCVTLRTHTYAHLSTSHLRNICYWRKKREMKPFCSSFSIHTLLHIIIIIIIVIIISIVYAKRGDNAVPFFIRYSVLE